MCGAQRDQRRVPRRAPRSARRSLRALRLGRAGVEGADGQRVAPGDGDRRSRRATRGWSSVRRSRSAARRSTTSARCPPGPRRAGPAPATARRPARQGHRVGDAHLAALRREHRLQHVGVRQVAPRDGAGTSGASVNRPPRRVEHRAEDARRVEVGQREPVDRAVVGDQRDRAPVADRRVASRSARSRGFAATRPTLSPGL